MKSNLIKRFLTVLWLVSLAFSLSACDSKTDQRIRVTFWHGMESGVNNRILSAKVNEFNRLHPNIFIDMQVYGAADQLGPKLDAAVAGRTPPDLLWWAPAFFPKYADAEVLREIDDFIRADKSFDKSDVYDFLWEMGSFDGKIYVTPFSANNLGLYYNRRMFAAASLDEPRSWDEFKTAAQKLTEGNARGFQIPIGSSEWTVWTWQTFLWQAGGELLTPDKKRAAFNSPAGVAALDLWREMLANHSAVFSETDAGYKTDAFLNQRVAMTINGPWNYPTLKNQAGVDFAVMPLPQKERAATNIGGESLFLFKSTPEKERAAWEFMKYVMSANFQVDWAIETGYLPISKSAANNPKYQAYLAANPFIKVYNDQMTAGKTRPSIPQYPAISATLGKYLEAALYNKMSSQAALDAAANEVDQLLQK